MIRSLTCRVRGRGRQPRARPEARTGRGRGNAEALRTSCTQPLLPRESRCRVAIREPPVSRTVRNPWRCSHLARSRSGLAPVAARRGGDRWQRAGDPRLRPATRAAPFQRHESVGGDAAQGFAYGGSSPGREGEFGGSRRSLATMHRHPSATKDSSRRVRAAPPRASLASRGRAARPMRSRLAGQVPGIPAPP